jgi:hypothetical protein
MFTTMAISLDAICFLCYQLSVAQCNVQNIKIIKYNFPLNHAALLIGERANVKTSTREKNKLAKENIDLGHMTGMDIKSVEMRT